MKQSKSITIALTSLMLTLPSHHAIASELDAHEHGSASLDIAIDTNTISMRFESPAVNIVGFEYATDDDQQLLLIQQAKNNLSNFDAVFQLVGDASCQTVESSANWVTKHEEDDHEDGHEDGHEGEDEDEDGHEDSPTSEHAEFIAEYQLKCKQADYLTAIDVNLFEFFPGISDLDVQVIHSGGQIKQELDSSNTLIRLTK
jgi:hypothetical protein